MAQTQGREFHISKKLAESRHKSVKIANLRKEVKHLQKHIQKILGEAKANEKWAEQQLDAAAHLLLKLRTPRFVAPYETINGVAVYTMQNVYEAFDIDVSDVDFGFADGTIVRAFEFAFDTLYYAAPRENFSTLVAVGKARRANKAGVIVEDLS